MQILPNQLVQQTEELWWRHKRLLCRVFELRSRVWALLDQRVNSTGFYALIWTVMGPDWRETTSWRQNHTVLLILMRQPVGQHRDAWRSSTTFMFPDRFIFKIKPQLYSKTAGSSEKNSNYILYVYISALYWYAFASSFWRSWLAPSKKKNIGNTHNVHATAYTCQSQNDPEKTRRENKADKCSFNL